MKWFFRENSPSKTFITFQPYINLSFYMAFPGIARELFRQGILEHISAKEGVHGPVDTTGDEEKTSLMG
ncbi:hypothetical protein ID850_00340 [Xenorhabdus sp. Flor]|uniref:hypothetical protein n=1 Tax=Xenorhabdus cabanillasii TaxID=351673 RepID=UPI00199D3003|nr:hypothetical protein [Xenorhabdus sp. Flor]MBD2813236.1 hypothetical protein [Xenorhabdus sp. Flor]